MRTLSLLLLLAVVAAASGCGRTEPLPTATTTAAATQADAQQIAIARSTEAPQLTTRVSGSLAKIDGNTLIVKLDGAPSYGESAAVAVDAEIKQIRIETNGTTMFLVDAEKGGLGDLEPGMKVSISPGPMNDPGRIAVVASSNKALVGGLVKLGDRDMVVNVRKKPVLVPIDDKTAVIFLNQVVDGEMLQGGRRIIADLRPGMHLAIVPETGTAKKILVTRWTAPAATGPHDAEKNNVVSTKPAPAPIDSSAGSSNRP